MKPETKCRNLAISCLFLTSKTRIGSRDTTSCSLWLVTILVRIQERCVLTQVSIDVKNWHP